MFDVFLNEEERLLKNTVREFAAEIIAPRAASLDETGEFPWENLRDMAALGLLGLGMDEEFGGSGGSTMQVVVTVEEIARACASTSTTFIAHHSLCANFINMYGTQGQKQQFLPPLIAGEKIGAFALTEPGAGSDAAAMRTSVAKSNGDYVLNGSKTFITNAPEASTFVVMATEDRSLRTRGIDSIIVERDTSGMTVNPIKGKMGIRASSIAEVVFQNARVPQENRLSGEREGFKATMSVLNVSRISIAAQCVGIAQAACDAAISYAKQREAFGQKLAEFQGLQWMIADMVTATNAARMLTYQSAMLKDRGMPFVTEASMAKLYASRAAVENADKAVQIHGGLGYVSPTPVERIYRDAKVNEIYEGTSEIQRMIIARNVLAE
jgi:butyryl-CoA dehydrogenase